MAAAVSSQYPRLDLTAALSSTTRGANDLFEDWARSFSANLVGPIFDAGRRSAEVNRAEAVKNQRLYTYGQTILTAFQEVEDALVQEKKQTDRIKSLESQVRLAENTYEQVRLEYVNGISNFIDVLTALTDAQQLRRDLVSAKLARIEYRIALYRALAGGFEIRAENENRD
jgi:outer membrane protein TolC